MIRLLGSRKPSALGSRVNAAIWDKIGRGAKKHRSDIAGGARGRVLEIGAGTGFNLSYYGPEVEGVVASEPSPHMLRRAEPRAREAAVAVELKQAPAEELPFEDASFDTVVSTLVMCSVKDPAKALSEIRRVLKPGGEFRFYEHVRASNRAVSFVQSAIITPVSRRLDGCHHDRETTRYIEEAGFEIKRLDKINFMEIKGVASPLN
ncbi:MAG: class I SAM-dependent methyltransferase [Chloroflexi bacterium]|nr:class I SAM-dependent methyltransferase [Chloroflexota bacterium]